MIARYLPRGWPTAVLMATSLVAIVAISAIVTSMEALALLFVMVLALAAIAVAAWRPTLLFYVYCAAIPLNFALPPGPAGTIARVVGVAFFVGYLMLRPDSLRPATVPLAGWLFIPWALASSLWAIDTETAYATWLSVGQLFAITVLIASLVATKPGVVGNALWWYAISATLTGVVGILVYLQGAEFSFGRGAAFADQGPAHFASLILPAAVFLMGEVQSRATSPFMRSVALTALVVCVAALAVSGTRSAWLGILVAIAAWLLLERNRRQLIGLGAVVLGLLILVVAVPQTEAFLLGRAESSVSTGGSGRTDIWAVGISILATAPLLGVGFGNFSESFTTYAITHASGSAVGGYFVAGRAAHNVLLGATVETGIVGGTLLFAFFATALLSSLGERGNVVRVALISLLVQSMFLDIIEQKQLWLFLALAFGLGAAHRLRATAADQAASSPPKPVVVIPRAT